MGGGGGPEQRAHAWLTLLGTLCARVPWRSADDFYKILTEPESNMIKQQQALLGTEDVELHFTGARREGWGGGAAGGCCACARRPARTLCVAMLSPLLPLLSSRCQTLQSARWRASPRR